VSDLADFTTWEVIGGAPAVMVVPAAAVLQRVVVTAPILGVRLAPAAAKAQTRNAYVIQTGAPESYLLAPRQALYAFAPVVDSPLRVYVAPHPDHDDPLELGLLWYDEEPEEG
jgi:hypothetical protein